MPTLCKDDFVIDELAAMFETQLFKDFVTDVLRDDLTDDLILLAVDNTLSIRSFDLVSKQAAIIEHLLWKTITSFCEMYPQYHPGNDDEDAEDAYAEEKRLDDKQRAQDMNQEMHHPLTRYPI